MLTEIKLSTNDVLILTLSNPNIPESVLNQISEKIKAATGIEPIMVSGKDSLHIAKMSAQ